MDRFWAALIAPFMLFALLLVIRPFTRWVARKLPDGWLKRILFIRW
jgi:hypothetical protein